MQDIRRRRCHVHAEREAVARCLSCSLYFCRECVTEHRGQVLCSACLAEQGAKKERRRARLGVVYRAAWFCGGFFLTWLVWFYLGKTLLGISDSLHGGSLWQVLDMLGGG